MGTINYGTNKILLTIGYKFYYPSDDEIKEYSNENETTETEANDILLDDCFFWMEESFNYLNSLIHKNNFNYYDVTLESGYYDGFYFSIKDKYYYLDFYNDKKEMLKELTIIKNILIEAIKYYNCFVVYPGWCSSWLKEKESINELNEAVKKERLRIKNLHTEKTFEKLSKAEKNQVIGFNLYK